MRRIAIINQKGGVGKTTTVANLGAALARAGKSVVVFDMDPQANLSLYLGSEVGRGDASVYGVLTDGLPVQDSLLKTNTPGLFLVASHLDLSGAELELASTMGRETLLRDAINLWEAESIEKDGFPPADYILLDCPPSLGLLSINALVAAEEVMIAVQTEFFALQGLSKLVEVVQLLRRRMNPALTLTGILPCLYDSRLKLAREVLAELRRFFPGKVYKTPVRSNVRLAESPSHGMTIFEYAPGSNGAKDYAAMGEELLRRSPTEERPMPSQVEVVNDDQAKELHRAAEGLRDLEAPAPEHFVPRPGSQESEDPTNTAQIEAQTEAQTVEPSATDSDDACPTPHSEAVEGVPATATIPETTDAAPTNRRNDGVDAELAAYELPRPKPEAQQAVPEPPQHSETPPKADLAGSSDRQTPDSLAESPREQAQSQPSIPGAAPAVHTDEKFDEQTATAILLEEAPQSAPAPSTTSESKPQQESPAPEPKPEPPKPTHVMGFADYIGEDRWTRKPDQNSSGQGDGSPRNNGA